MQYRKNATDLTAQEKRDFVEAVWALKRSGRYDQYVEWHVMAMRRATPAPGESPDPNRRNAAHRGPAFLPWHREFLRRFERDLRTEVPGVRLPYWDWTADAALDDPGTAPVWADDLMGGNGDPDDEGYVKAGPFAHDPDDPNAWKTANAAGEPIDEGLRREFGVGVPTLPTAADAYGDPDDPDDEGALGIVPYDTAPWDVSSESSYRNANEGWANVGNALRPDMHNRVHVWVGGSMLPGTSPNDPVFFLHHCFVDKLWADWQARHPDEDYLPEDTDATAPEGHRAADPLYPWNATPNDVLDHRRLGHLYDTDVPLIEPATPSLDFGSVPRGATTIRAATFSVIAHEDVRLNVLDGPTATSGPGVFGTPLGSSVTVSPRDAAESEGRIWLSYTRPDTDDTATADTEGTVAIRCPETNEEWSIPLTAAAATEPAIPPN